MKGFDPRWRDIPDYILGITHEIWEGRAIASLRQSYAPEIMVRSPSGIVVGTEAVIAATMATLAEFPDRVLLGEDVIWSGDPGAGTGVLSSHRILSRGTHRGGALGPPTGRVVTYRVIADCHTRDDRIDDEWIIRDLGAIVRQIGRDPREAAQAAVEAAQASGSEPAIFTPAKDRPGPYAGRGNDDPWGARLASILERLMAAEFSAIPAEYDRACTLHHPGGATGHGHKDADRLWMSLRAAFPSAVFRTEHVIGRDDPAMPPRAAIRWSLQGRHDGWGAFGRPTGAEVHVMGITHAEFGPWGLRREWTLYDEVAVWTQVLASSGGGE